MSAQASWKDKKRVDGNLMSSPMENLASHKRAIVCLILCSSPLGITTAQTDEGLEVLACFKLSPLSSQEAEATDKLTSRK